MADELISAILSHQREAELNFAACVLMVDDAATDYGYLDPDKFLEPEIRRFWTEVRSGEEPAKAAIRAGIYYQLNDHLSDTVSAHSTIGAFAEAITTDAYLVAVCEKNNDLARKLIDRDTDAVREIVREMANAIPQQRQAHTNAAEVHLEILEHLDDPDRTIKTGFSNLDRAIGGMERGSLTMIAARPSMGKSSLAWQIGQSNAARGLKVLFVSLEMSKAQLWGRAICGRLEIEYRLYAGRMLTEPQKDAFRKESTDLVSELEDRMIVEDGTPKTIEDVWQIVAEVKPDLVILDHLGCVAFDARRSEVDALGSITQTAKNIAKNFDCAFLLLVQLSRGVESRDDHQPELRDLRGSGKIEENGDCVLFIYRDDYYKEAQPGKTVSHVELIIAKNRMGSRNDKVHLEYHLMRQKFYPMAKP